jgi:hypothetical protein
MTMNLVYQLLALDPNEKTRSENAVSLLYLIRGFSKLWDDPRVAETERKILDGAVSLTATEVEDAPDAERGEELGRAFLITLNGPYESVEPIREPLASFLKDQDFELLYVLRDQVSEHIACKLYPHLYRIENLLRGYLIRFMATRIGPRWWELTASAEMTDKAKMRKKNERAFGKHIENSAFLIDFDELGEIVYEQSSGFLTREDVVARVTELPETPEAIRGLKQELRSNYLKLFKESFADKQFKDKWKEFEVLRNKIAHNNLFTADDLVVGERLAKEITDIIKAADVEAAKLVITTEEREAIKEQVAKASSWQTAELTETAFLAELDRVQSKFALRNGFVGLTYFVNNVLIPQRYSYASSHAMIQHLSRTGQIEVYYVPHPNDPAKQTAAIRRPI